MPETDKITAMDLPPVSMSRFFTISFALIFLALCGPAAASEGPDARELAKSPAARFYVQKEYDSALVEFEKLENQYPQNTTIKRYVALTLQSLNRVDEAIRKLEQTISINDRDWIAKRMLGEAYLKNGNYQQAQQVFVEIVTGSEDDSSVKYAKKKSDQITKLLALDKTENGKQLGVQAFLGTSAAEEFKKQNYQAAEEGFRALSAAYPQDLLIRRFWGITLLKLNQPEQAEHIFLEALKLAPDNTALHYYLGEAYFQRKDVENARKEYRWVMANDSAQYQARAQRSLFKTLSGAKKSRGKRWALNLSSAYEYDSNATYKTRDSSLATAGHSNSSRFVSSIIGTYRFYEKNKFALTADTLYTQSLYEDYPNLQTYTFGGGITALAYGFKVFGRPSFFSLREGITATILKNRFYVGSNTLSPSFVINWAPAWRTVLGHRFTYSQYESRTSTPDLTNREGFSNSFFINNTWFLNEAKTLHVTVGYEYERAEPLGVNYIKNVHGGRLELKFPILKKLSGHVLFRYKDSFYPKFASGVRRWDHDFVLTPTLSWAFNDQYSLNSYYTYNRSMGKNNDYEYSRSVFGVGFSANF